MNEKESASFQSAVFSRAIARVFSATLRLPPSLPLMSPFGLPSAGSVGSHSPEMSHPSGCSCSLPRNRPVAWFPASARWHVSIFPFPLPRFPFRVPPMLLDSSKNSKNSKKKSK